MNDVFSDGVSKLRDETVLEHLRGQLNPPLPQNLVELRKRFRDDQLLPFILFVELVGDVEICGLERSLEK